MRSQGISQFYLHTLRSSANRMNHTCVFRPSRSWSSFTDPRGWKAELAWNTNEHKLLYLYIYLSTYLLYNKLIEVCQTSPHVL